MQHRYATYTIQKFVVRFFGNKVLNGCVSSFQMSNSNVALLSILQRKGSFITNLLKTHANTDV